MLDAPGTRPAPTAAAEHAQLSFCFVGSVRGGLRVKVWRATAFSYARFFDMRGRTRVSCTRACTYSVSPQAPRDTHTENVNFFMFPNWSIGQYWKINS